MTTAEKASRTSCLDCQVLVVGAGPTGLVLAADLLARGVSTRVIDKGDGVALETRAIAIHARALEVLDLMGLADRFAACGQQVRHFTFYADGKRRVSLDLSRNGTRFGFMLDIPQHDTERLLRTRVAELGGGVENGAELVGLDDDASGVLATIATSAGKQIQIHAGYVVGCDGAHSRVRHELGVPFDGYPYPQDWLLADVSLDWTRPDNEAHAFFTAGGLPLICFPMRDHKWRVTVPFVGDRRAGPPTLAEIQHFIDVRAPERVVVSDASWLANFRCHRRSTEVYRRGRVLLAGDAVHIHTPAGGQGMNTGITDAHNLAWKLALVTAGRASDKLLDSYGDERRPVAAQVIGLTDALVRYGTMSNPVRRAVRDAVIPALVQVGPVHRRVIRRWTQVNVAYPASNLTRADPGKTRPRPGERVPDMPVASHEESDCSLFSVLRRGQHVLVVPGWHGAVAQARVAAEPYQDLLEIVTTARGSAAEVRGSQPDQVLLVRPDGYLAARAAPNSLGRVIDYLRELSGGRRAHPAEDVLSTGPVADPVPVAGR